MLKKSKLNAMELERELDMNNWLKVLINANWKRKKNAVSRTSDWY